MGTTARSAVRTAIAQELQVLKTGTATSGTTTTLIDTARRKEPDDSFNGDQLLKTGGTGSGEIADISDFTQSTSTLTLAETQTAADGTTTYEIYRRPFTVADYNAAITAALDEAYAAGFARRGWDETLYTSGVQQYTMPTTLEDISEVLVSGPNRLSDPDWYADGSGWTVHADGSFGNTGDSQARALSHAASGANNYSTCVVSVQPGVEYAFRVRAISVSSTPVAVARYQFRDRTGTLIGSATNFGTHTSATSGLISGTFTAPVAAYQVVIGLGTSSASGTVRFWEHHLRVRYDDQKAPRGSWDLDWNGTTGLLMVRERASFPPSRVLRLRGRRTLEALSADSDTVSFDAPELRAFVYLCCAKLWEQRQGRVPDTDRNHAEGQAQRFRADYERIANGLRGAWRRGTSILLPTG